MTDHQRAGQPDRRDLRDERQPPATRQQGDPRAQGRRCSSTSLAGRFVLAVAIPGPYAAKKARIPEFTGRLTQLSYLGFIDGKQAAMDVQAGANIDDAPVMLEGIASLQGVLKEYGLTELPLCRAENNESRDAGRRLQADRRERRAGEQRPAVQAWRHGGAGDQRRQSRPSYHPVAGRSGPVS